jgi:hypothetical protein
MTAIISNHRWQKEHPERFRRRSSNGWLASTKSAAEITILSRHEAMLIAIFTIGSRLKMESDRR